MLKLVAGRMLYGVLAAAMCFAPASHVVAQTAYDLAGKAFNPLKFAAGKPVVLIFVRTDCPVSNRYAPTLRTLTQNYIDRAQFYLVYPDRAETAVSIEKHVQEYNLQMIPLRDSNHELVRAAKVEITPEIAVFDRSGKLIYHGRIDNWYKDFGRARPAPTTHEMDEAIFAALNGTPAPVSASGVGCYISDLR